MAKSHYVYCFHFEYMNDQSINKELNRLIKIVERNRGDIIDINLALATSKNEWSMHIATIHYTANFQII